MKRRVKKTNECEDPFSLSVIFLILCLYTVAAWVFIAGHEILYGLRMQ